LLATDAREEGQMLVPGGGWFDNDVKGVRAVGSSLDFVFHHRDEVSK
jgi:hypothetical protein